MSRIVVDGHQDIACNYFHNGRDFTRSVQEHRRRETDPVRLARYGRCMVGLPEEIEGRVAIVCATIFVPPAWSTLPDEKMGYETPEEAHRLGIQQLEYYQRLADSDDRIVLVFTRRDLDAVLMTWDDTSASDDQQVGIILLMEGADPILEPAQLESWYERGLRIVGPAWSATRYSGGTRAPGPLTDLGHDLLDAMEELEMILDLSHMAPEACRAALDRYTGPLWASHANPLRFRPDFPDRNLADDLMRLIAEHDGAVGIMPYNLFLVKGWQLGDRKDAASMDTVITAIDHVCQVTGSARHVGIGSDFDGGFGSAATPVGFDTVADLQKIGPALAARGYAPADITAILSGNFLRVLRAGLPGD